MPSSACEITYLGANLVTGSLSRDPGKYVVTFASSPGSLTPHSFPTRRSSDLNLVIGTRGITVTADPQSKTYGDADPALTSKVTAGNLVGTDALTGSLTRDIGNAHV